MNRYIIVFLSSVLLLSGCLAPPEVPQENVSNETAPVEVTCGDTDDGTEESEKGTVTIDGKRYEDRCADASVLLEYYCDNSDLGIKSIVCSEGHVCDSGACVLQPPLENVTVIKCQETDSGKDYQIAGSVTYEGDTYSDTCQGSSDLLEYYCENDELKQTTYHCATGDKCIDGACLPMERTCIDSDEDDDTVAGTTTQYGGGVVMESKQDSCVDTENKIEYYCEGDLLKSRAESCLEDTYCSNGACIPLCWDGDSGKDYETAASATDPGGAYADYCRDDNKTVVEYYCSNNNLLSTVHTCSRFCYDGRCLKDSDIDCREISRGRTVRFLYDSEVLEEINDTCLDHRLLRDYLCIDDDIEFANVVCDDDEICYDRDCMQIFEPTCYDLDLEASEDYEYVKSSAVETTNESVDKIKEDECLGYGTLIEYMCDGNSITSEYVTCPDEERCLNGACVYLYTCSDSDGGKSLEPGAASLWENGDLIRSERDACADDDTVWEVFCSEDGRIQYAYLNCPEGTQCDSTDGSCK